MDEGGNQIRFFFVSNSITLKRFMDLAMLHPYLGTDLDQGEVQKYVSLVVLLKGPSMNYM